MADQPVEVVSYNPAWPARFADMQPAVEQLLQPWLTGPVEHIGSTSVPGLAAKPVIDMLALVSSLDQARNPALSALTAVGWLDWPDDPASYYRLWFLFPSPDKRTHHLHVLECGEPHARALVAFRDLLRSDMALRQEYADLKQLLALEHPDNRNAYTNAKGDFVDRVLRDAGFQVPGRDLLPE